MTDPDPQLPASEPPPASTPVTANQADGPPPSASPEAPAKPEVAAAAPPPAPDPAARRKQLEEEIRQRLEAELAARHGDDVAAVASGAAPKAKKPEGKADKARAPMPGKPPREKTEQEKQQDQLRLQKAAIAGRAKKIMYVAYAAITLIAIAVGYILFFSDKAKSVEEEPESSGNAPAANGQVANPDTAVSPATPRLGREVQGLLKRAKQYESEGNYMLAVDELGKFEGDDKQDRWAVEMEKRRLRETYPKETGQTAEWQATLAEINKLVRARRSPNARQITEAMEMVVAFKVKHSDQLAVAEREMVKLNEMWRKLMGNDVPLPEIEDPTLEAPPPDPVFPWNEPQ